MKRLLRYVVIVALCLGAGPANAIEGLVGWWTFDEGVGTTAYDSSANNNHGIFVGDPKWIDGPLNGAVELNGTDYIETGNQDQLAVWTIACWVKSPEPPKHHGQAVGPVHRGGNYQFNWNHWFDGQEGTVAFRIGSQWYLASLMPLDGETWYHIAGTYDGEDLKAYRNGVLVDVNSLPSGASGQESNSLKIGRHANQANYFFSGAIDDARVYDRALSADEIAALALISTGTGLDIRISDPNDDVEQHLPTGRVDLNSSELKLVHEPGGGRFSNAGEQVVGLRFVDIPLWRGGVSRAHLEFTVADIEGGTDPVNLAIEGQLDSNAPPFASDANNVSNRLRTTTQVKWEIPNWTLIGERFQTPDLSPIIEEIVAQEAWQYGNSLVLILQNDADHPSAGIRIAESFEGNASLSPLLHIEPDPLVAHWRFDEAAGDIAFDSTGLFDGVISGATRTTSGIAGRGLLLDGEDDLVDCGTDAALAPKILTISAWIKPFDLTSVASVVQKGGDLFDADVDLAIYANRVRFQFGNGIDFVSVRSNAVLEAEQWTMVSGTRYPSGDGYEASVYINGVKDNSELYDFSAVVGDLPLIIAGPAGEIDDVRIYREALNAETLLDLYLDTPEPFDPNLICHWAFDEGSGEIAFDVISGFDGVISGATWTTGVASNALHFDGEDDLVDCGNLEVLGASDLTVSIWVKLDEFASRKSLVHQGGSLFEADFDLLISSTGQVYFEFGSSEVFDFVSIRSESQLSHDWHLVTARRTESVAELLIDGIEEDSHTYGFPVQIRDLPLIIGGPRGTIDDVRIYNRTLTTEEVSDLLEIASL